MGSQNQHDPDEGALFASGLTGSSASATLNLEEYEAQALPRRRALVESGVLVTRDKLLEHLNVQRLTEMRKRWDSLCSVEVDERVYYPLFYVTSAARLETLVDVSQRLTPLKGWSVFYFFRHPSAALGGLSPLEALERSDTRGDLRLRWKVDALAAERSAAASSHSSAR